MKQAIFYIWTGIKSVVTSAFPAVVVLSIFSVAIAALYFLISLIHPWVLSLLCILTIIAGVLFVLYTWGRDEIHCCPVCGRKFDDPKNVSSCGTRELPHLLWGKDFYP